MSNSDEDILYHLGITSKTYDFKKVLGDIKFVCTGGSVKRIENFAKCLLERLPINSPFGVQPKNLCQSDRFVMYKVGPVLCVNHGIGFGSLSIMLNEVFKLLRYAGCTDVTFFRVGTSGGIGMRFKRKSSSAGSPGGTLVITKTAVDGLLQESYEAVLKQYYYVVLVLGKSIRYPTVLNEAVSEELKKIAEELGFNVVTGKTLSANDFYEGEARLDGALCSYTEEEKMQFIQKAYALGVRNMEMEATCFAAMCLRAHFKAAVICVALLDRLKEDQLTTPPEELRQWEARPMEVVLQYICRHIDD
ncbi:unnamed protein product [Soboliphyme baturini]|uniref:PNP_UDP_1 domain-containing protein n=1 Tax=Soboliphyme baturini TaxID=241478 RepID=A0A183I8W7_9BILA|nr:unnamed protein product [Soboliphyme baturini]